MESRCATVRARASAWQSLLQLPFLVTPLNKEQSVGSSSVLALVGQMLSWRPDSFAMAVVSTLVFGLVGVFLAILGYKLFDWLTPRVHVEVELAEKHNIAVAI